MVITNYNYNNDKTITALAADDSNEFIWMAFAQNSDGNCIIEKQSPYLPTQTFFSINRAVDKVVSMDIIGSSLFTIYEDDTSFMEKFTLGNPLTSTTSINKPVGITENPIDMTNDGSFIYVLFPGSLSGTNAKVLKYNTSLVLQDTIDLSKSGSIVNNARSITIDSNGDIWIVTYTDPSNLIRVYEISGGFYDFTLTEIS